MRIGIDIREIEKGAYTGFRTVLRNFLAYMDKAGKHEFILFGNQHTDLSSIRTNAEIVIIKEINTFLWDQFSLPLALKKKKVDVFFSHYIKTPLWRVCPYVNTVADIIPLTASKYRGFRSLLDKVHFSFYASICSRRAAKVITISNDAKKRILGRFRIDPAKLEVIYPAIEVKELLEEKERPGKKITEKYDLESPYLLYIGNFKPHKNLDNLIFAYEFLPQTIKDNYRLFLVGGSEKEIAGMKQRLAKRGLSGKVIPVEKLTGRDIFHFLKNAAVFIFPSLDEGFGIPPVEAMAMGVPVASSNAGPMPEVLGDAATFFDPYRPEDISKTVTRLINEKDLKAQCIERGKKRALLYNTEEMSEKILDVLENAGKISAKKVLLLNLGGIGNSVLSYPLVKALKTEKNCEVKIAVSERSVESLLKSLGLSGEEIWFLEPRFDRLIKQMLKIRKERFELGIASAYTNWLKSWVLFSFLDIKIKMSFVPRIFSFLFTKGAHKPSLHEYEIHKVFADSLGVKLPLFPRIDIEGDRQFADGFLNENNIGAGDLVIGMHLGSGKKQAELKRWPVAKYASLARLIKQNLKGRVVLMGGPEEKALEDSLAGSNVEFASAIGKTDFNRLAALVKKCDVVVGGDSGVMHFTASLDVPTVTIFGPTDFRKIKPLSRYAKMIRSQKVSSVDPENVLGKIKEILKETGRLK